MTAEEAKPERGGASATGIDRRTTDDGPETLTGSSGSEAAAQDSAIEKPKPLQSTNPDQSNNIALNAYQ